MRTASSATLSGKSDTTAGHAAGLISRRANLQVRHHECRDNVQACAACTRAVQLSQHSDPTVDESEKSQQKAQDSASKLGETGRNTAERQKEIHGKLNVPRGLPVFGVGDVGLEPTTSTL